MPALNYAAYDIPKSTKYMFFYVLLFFFNNNKDQTRLKYFSK